MMDEALRQQIELLQKENSKLSRQLARLQATLDRNKAVASSLTNIDNMREVENKKQQRYLQLLLENSPDIIIIFDRGGRFAHCTNAFLKIAKIPHFGLINGKLFAEVFGAFADRVFVEKFAAQLYAVMRENQSLAFEDVIDFGSGAPRKYMVHFTPLMSQEGHADSSLMLLHDITEIRSAQENAEIAREAAECASLAKSEFLANMSHEIRTPLNAVIGMTAIAKTSASLEKKKYCLQKIEEASTHLLGIINDILDMSKIEANKLEIDAAPFYFEKMIQKVINVVNFRVEEKKLHFLVRLDQRIPHFLEGDEQRLAQIIANLLSNAVKFTPEYGFVRLEAQLLQEQNNCCLIRLAVSDSGIGISPEQQSKLFASFQQADTSTSRKFGGTGLGLAISKRLVELMGGNIRVESEAGKGSTFSVVVPLENCAQGQAARPVPAVSLGNVRLCALSGTPELLEYLQDILRRCDLDCDSFAGVEAFKGVQASYDLGFLDWNTLAPHGLDILRHLAEQGIRRAVLLTSSLDWNAISEEAGRAGVTHFLIRPLFASNVLDCLNQCLGRETEQKQKEEVEEINLLGYRILLAEDVDINREIVLAFLEPTGLDIECAENGAEAVRMFSAAPDRYDMIFMDIQMPEMDGYEATRCIRALDIPSSGKVPIIAMTANVFREDVQRCLKAGMNDHIGKPLELPTVLEKLRRYLPLLGHS